MRVYTYFDCDSPPGLHEADFIRLWERSWRNQGWEPRVLTAINARKSKHWRSHTRYDERWMSLLAFQSTGGGGWFSDPHIMNFSFKPEKPHKPHVASRGSFLMWVAPRRADDWWTGRIPLLYQNTLSVRFQHEHWDLAPLVDFTNYNTTDVVTTCGREIN